MLSCLSLMFPFLSAINCAHYMFAQDAIISIYNCWLYYIEWAGQCLPKSWSHYWMISGFLKKEEISESTLSWIFGHKNNRYCQNQVAMHTFKYNISMFQQWGILVEWLEGNKINVFNSATLSMLVWWKYFSLLWSIMIL